MPHDVIIRLLNSNEQRKRVAQPDMRVLVAMAPKGVSQKHPPPESVKQWLEELITLLDISHPSLLPLLFPPPSTTLIQRLKSTFFLFPSSAQLLPWKPPAGGTACRMASEGEVVNGEKGARCTEASLWGSNDVVGTPVIPLHVCWSFVCNWKGIWIWAGKNERGIRYGLSPFKALSKEAVLLMKIRS